MTSATGAPQIKPISPISFEGIGVAPNHDVFISGLCRVRSVNGGTGIIQTIAGLPDPGIPYNTICASSGDGGPASAAGLGNPGDIKADLAGNLYIIDVDHTVVRRIDATTGIITRFAGGGTTIPGTGPALAMNLGNVRCIAPSDDGFLYISNDTRVFRVDLATTELTPVAGNGNAGFSGDNGPALQAEFDTIAGLAAAPGGGLFVSDSLNQRIRYIVPTSINLSGNLSLTAIHYPFISALAGDLIITNNPNATTIALGSVTTVDGDLRSTAGCGSATVSAMFGSTGEAWAATHRSSATVDSATGDRPQFADGTLGRRTSTISNCGSATVIDVGSLAGVGGRPRHRQLGGLHNFTIDIGSNLAGSAAASSIISNCGSATSDRRRLRWQRVWAAKDLDMSAAIALRLQLNLCSISAPAWAAM